MQRASSATNEGLAANLAELDRLSSPHVIEAFRHVDRGFFVPAEHRGAIYEDRPFRVEFPDGAGALHMSAPHMYAMALEALEMPPGSGHSFLNVGSGTGYMSTLAAFLVGPEGRVDSVEVFPRVIEWSKKRFAEFAATPLIPGMPHHGSHRDSLARDFQFVHANVLSIDVSQNRKYERIYVGAQGTDPDLQFLKNLLSPGGVLVGPFDDKFTRVRRSTDGQSFNAEVLSGVRFAALVRPNKDSPQVVVQPTDEEIQRQKIGRLCTVCGVDEGRSKALLLKADWRLDAAAEQHFNDKAASEAAAAATAAAAEPAAEAAAETVSIAEGEPPNKTDQLQRQSSHVTVDSWLQTIKLDRYSAAIKEAGYDEILFLKDADQSDIEELMQQAGLKKPHAKTFKRAWGELVALPLETATHRTSASEAVGSTGAIETTTAGGHGSVELRQEDHGSAESAELAVAANTLFGSMRFKNGRILPEAIRLQTELKKVGLDLTVVDMSAGGDIDTTVFGGIERADTFLVFGTSDYGQDTGNPASTFYESKFAQNTKRRIILIKMIPPNGRFEHLQARQLFGVNKLCLEWIEGQPLPPTLVSELAKAIADPSTAPRARGR